MNTPPRTPPFTPTTSTSQTPTPRAETPTTLFLAELARNRQHQTSPNTEIIKEYIQRQNGDGEVNISRRTDIDRRGVYVVSMQLPSGLRNIEIYEFTREALTQILQLQDIGVNFELTTIPQAMAMLSRNGERYFEITDNGYLRFALLYRPTTFTINRNANSREELARLQIYFERGDISKRQFNSIRTQLTGTNGLIPQKWSNTYSI